MGTVRGFEYKGQGEELGVQEVNVQELNS